MSEQDGRQSSTKQRRNHKTNTANQQNGKQAPAAQRPTNDDKEAWKAYWKEQDQPWRTEPEIDTERQKYLAERRSITPDIEQGIYPFKDVKLSRADVEWLLATHENGRGPVDWNDEKSLHERRGLDLRGANLSGVDLSHLPLACMQGALKWEEWVSDAGGQRNMTAVCMEKAYLREAQLQGADLWEAQLQGAYLRGAQMQEAHLWGAQLQKANLRRAQLQGADLRRTDLDHATLDLVTFSDQTYGAACFADIKWGSVNLAVIDWGHVKRLGDEQQARQKKDSQGQPKEKETRVAEYKDAVRANRQLAVVLRDQGLNEEADHFAYRAQKLQRIVFRRQRQFGRYFFLGFLDFLAGYGYRPGRSVLWYFAIVCGFALGYHLFGQLSLFPPDAFVYSLTSFHGRGFFPGLEHRTSLHDPLIMLAAIEAVVGLFIEISFIATFTQRFFGR